MTILNDWRFPKTSTSPLVSVITPAYNEEDVISECIESVLRQDYDNWEYLVVNNCSSDRTLEIAQRYAAKEPRIRVISNETLLPAMANFNSALRKVSPESKYCKIVFADDSIFPECIGRMVGLAEANPSVGIVGAYGIEGQWVLWEGIPCDKSVSKGKEVCRERLLGGPYVFGSSTSVLYRSDLVRKNDPFFNEATAHAADSEVCFKLLKKCDFGFVHQVLTFSRKRAGSLLTQSQALNASAADTLHELVLFGREFLSEHEYEMQLKVTLDRYYDFLASSVTRRDRSFWSFHESAFRDCGVSFRRRRILQALLRKVINRLRVRQAQPRWGL
ncbi:MAG TPA: glycosyltransferase family 2 protein [Terracidiphilus sp.]|jgi:glycosyltransferase involved in cell wall biosynthesis